MKKIIINSSISLCLSLLIFPFIKAVSNGTGNNDLVKKVYAVEAVENNEKELSEKVATLYDSLNLENIGLSMEVLEHAMRGYEKLNKKGLIRRPGLLTIADFSQSSTKKRLYLIDMINYELVMNTYVAHGRNSGKEFATAFSNRHESHQSSLGFYVTKNPYFGQHGLSLRLEGVEKGFNDNAFERAIVLHGAPYAQENFSKSMGYLGRSWGCPAVPSHQSKEIINTIKEGTCLFIYHPTQKYLNGSDLLNS